MRNSWCNSTHRNFYPLQPNRQNILHQNQTGLNRDSKTMTKPCIYTCRKNAATVWKNNIGRRYVVLLETT